MAAGGVAAPGPRIFISYRRADTDHAAGRLTQDLRGHFGHEQVFQDIASIDPGADFVDALEQGLDTCAAVLVVIGPNWLSAADQNGYRRLDLSNDWVRREVAESLERTGVRVFPVLVSDARMPRQEELPESLQALTRRQAFELTSRHWANDVAKLVSHLKQVPGIDLPQASRTPEEKVQPAEKLAARPWKWLVRRLLLAVAIIGVLGTFWLILREGLPQWPIEAVPVPRAPSDKTAPSPPMPNDPIQSPTPTEAVPVPRAPSDKTAPSPPMPNDSIQSPTPTEAVPVPRAPSDKTAPSPPTPNDPIQSPTPTKTVSARIHYKTACGMSGLDLTKLQEQIDRGLEKMEIRNRVDVRLAAGFERESSEGIGSTIIAVAGFTICPAASVQNCRDPEVHCAHTCRYANGTSSLGNREIATIELADAIVTGVRSRTALNEPYEGHLCESQ